MAYTHLGLDVAGLVTTAEAATKVARDPGLPEVTCNVLRLNRITEGLPPGPPCARRRYTAAEKRRGIGLAKMVAPLRGAVWARQHPAQSIAIGVGVIGALVGLGYWWGRGAR